MRCLHHTLKFTTASVTHAAGVPDMEMVIQFMETAGQHKCAPQTPATALPVACLPQGDGHWVGSLLYRGLNFSQASIVSSHFTQFVPWLWPR